MGNAEPKCPDRDEGRPVDTPFTWWQVVASLLLAVIFPPGGLIIAICWISRPARRIPGIVCLLISLGAWTFFAMAFTVCILTAQYGG